MASPAVAVVDLAEAEVEEVDRNGPVMKADGQGPEDRGQGVERRGQDLEFR